MAKEFRIEIMIQPETWVTISEIALIISSNPKKKMDFKEFAAKKEILISPKRPENEAQLEIKVNPELMQKMGLKVKADLRLLPPLKKTKHN